MRIIERQKTAKGGHRAKSKFGGTESVVNHGKFIIDNIEPTAPTYADDSGLAKSKELNKRLTIGTANHSAGEFINPEDYNRPAAEKRGDQMVEYSFKKTRRSRNNRNGSGSRNIDIHETGSRQMMLYAEDWFATWTNWQAEDVIVTWFHHAGLQYSGISIE